LTVNALKILEERGFIEQLTHPKEMYELFDRNESVPFYIGIDPTADSLHVGHFVSLMVASYLQKCGHKPIILVGGGTASIGDPSGKTDMRKMLSREQIDANVASIKKQVEKFVSFEGENAAIIVNNADWLLGLNYIDFMREIGSLFSINRMLAAECYKQRLETGLTFFELGYMLMQSYDFLHLYNTYGCKLEIGGNDQWSNIIGGVDLIRKIGRDDSYGLTFKLLTTKEGKKMGKTEKGALWLDANKVSPYEFYQYWRNIEDESVEMTQEIKDLISSLESKGSSSLIYLAIAKKLAGIISIYDPLKPEAKEVVQELRDIGFDKVIMLTGDSPNCAKAIAKQLNLDDFRAGVLPEDKASYIESLKKEGNTVVMVGDGINDTPALSMADVSISLQDSSDIARELADITLVSNSLNDIVALRMISEGLFKRIHSQYRLIVGLNTSFIVLGALGLLTPQMLAMLHNGSTFLIASGSTRSLLH